MDSARFLPRVTPIKDHVFYRCLTITQWRWWLEASHIPWVFSIQRVKRITTGSGRSHIHKPTSSSFVTRSCPRHRTKTSKRSGYLRSPIIASGHLSFWSGHRLICAMTRLPSTNWQKTSRNLSAMKWARSWPRSYAPSSMWNVQPWHRYDFLGFEIIEFIANHSSFELQKGLKNVFDEAILAALEPPEQKPRRRCRILWITRMIYIEWRFARYICRRHCFSRMLHRWRNCCCAWTTFSIIQKDFKEWVAPTLSMLRSAWWLDTCDWINERSLFPIFFCKFIQIRARCNDAQGFLPSNHESLSLKFS